MKSFKIVGYSEFTANECYVNVKINSKTTILEFLSNIPFDESIFNWNDYSFAIANLAVGVPVNVPLFPNLRCELFAHVKLVDGVCGQFLRLE